MNQAPSQNHIPVPPPIPLPPATPYGDKVKAIRRRRRSIMFGVGSFFLVLLIVGTLVGIAMVASRGGPIFSTKGNLVGKWRLVSDAKRSVDSKYPEFIIEFRQDHSMLGYSDHPIMWRQQEGMVELQFGGPWYAVPCLWIDRNHIQFWQFPDPLERIE